LPSASKAAGVENFLGAEGAGVLWAKLSTAPLDDPDPPRGVFERILIVISARCPFGRTAPSCTARCFPEAPVTDRSTGPAGVDVPGKPKEARAAFASAATSSYSNDTDESAEGEDEGGAAGTGEPAPSRGTTELGGAWGAS